MRAMGVRDGDFEVAGLEPRTMPGQQDKIRQLVFDLTEREKPDIAFILSSEDDHQDHATLGKACQVVMKNRVPNIIRCHNPWNFINPGRANLFVRLSPDEFEAKLAVIRSYTSQLFRYDYEGLFTAITQANGLATKNRLAEAFEIAYLIAGEE
jgi:LmbE family N-acetylglucosaminyl deacetylase